LLLVLARTGGAGGVKRDWSGWERFTLVTIKVMMEEAVGSSRLVTMLRARLGEYQNSFTMVMGFSLPCRLAGMVRVEREPRTVDTLHLVAAEVFVPDGDAVLQSDEGGQRCVGKLAAESRWHRDTQGRWN